jgi:hypothetical protein
MLKHGKQCEELQKIKAITFQPAGDTTHEGQFTLYVMTPTGNRPSEDQQFALVFKLICITPSQSAVFYCTTPADLSAKYGC